LNLTGSNKPLLLVHRGIKNISVDERINIMLTPQFYTVKREELPVQYLYQAKKIAPSLFEGLLEADGEYEYFVFKEEGHWVFIAYDPKEISAFLSAKGLSSENISKVYFAQQVPNAFEKPIVLSDKEALLTIDNNVTVIPVSILSDDTKRGVFDKMLTPKSGITLQQDSASFISRREAFVLAAIFMVFAGIFFTEGWYYSRNINMQQKEMEELLEAYPALQSKMQRDSIAMKYKKIDTQERKKRETIKKLASMIFKGVDLASFHMNEKQFKATFSCADSRTMEKLTLMVKKSNFAVKNDKSSNIVVIEGKL
jgi:hypothetical protein